jgi:hypothetical protein
MPPAQTPSRNGASQSYTWLTDVDNEKITRGRGRLRDGAEAAEELAPLLGVLGAFVGILHHHGVVLGVACMRAIIT